MTAEFMGKGGAIIAMQKDAYNALATNTYSVKVAVEGDLKSQFNGIVIYGTPPTRWLHTNKMKACLLKIKAEILNQ